MHLRLKRLVEFDGEMGLKVVKLRVVKGSKEVKFGKRFHERIGARSWLCSCVLEHKEPIR